jgi:hypothetical protein
MDGIVHIDLRRDFTVARLLGLRVRILSQQGSLCIQFGVYRQIDVPAWG